MRQKLKFRFLIFYLGVIELAEDEDPSKKTIFGAKSTIKQRGDDSSDDDDDW